jgi:hypothetical protein
MAGVPDTTTFSLQDVVDVIPGTQTSLQECFDEAIEYFFDPAYAGSKTSLLNFRNYGGNVEYQYAYIGAASGELYKVGAGWSTQRNAGTADALVQVGDIEVSVDEVIAGVNYNIYRNFFAYDLSDIPAGSTCNDAILGFRETDQFSSSNFDPIGVVAAQGIALAVGDFGSLTFSSILFDVYASLDTGKWGSETGFTDQLSASGAGRLLVEDAFGGTLYVAMINDYHDRQDNAPDGHYGIEHQFSGELYSGADLYLRFSI